MSVNPIRTHRSFGKWLITVAGICLCLVLIIEGAIRISGIMDVPLYRADPVLGYIPRADQSGRYLHRHSWAFDDKSMGVSAPFRPKHDDVLLLGDSIVYGGVRQDNPLRLGPLVQTLSGRTVWPLSASSWGVENELAAYRVTAGTAIIDTVVLVSNTADFDQPSVWRSELTHPRSYPHLMSVYLIGKVMGDLWPADPPPAIAPIMSDRALHAMRSFLATFHGRLIWVLYPKRTELDREPPLFAQLRASVGDRAKYIYPARDPQWTKALYTDETHPSVAGDRLLARMIAKQLETLTPE